MEQETIAQTMLDQLVTDENSQMLKALIPYLSFSDQRILAAKLKDPIRPDAADGDDVLYRFRNRKSFFVLLQCILQSFNQV